MVKKIPISPIILGGAIVVLIAGVVTAIVVHHATPTVSATPPPAVAIQTATVSPIPTATTTSSATPAASPSATPSGLVDGDITWLAEPQAIGNLKLIKDNAAIEQNHPGKGTATYYKVGTRAGLDVILAQMQPDGPSFSDDGFLFVQESALKDHYDLVTDYNAITVSAYQTSADSNDKPYDNFTNLVIPAGRPFPSLSLPGTIVQDGVTFESDGDSYALYSSLVKTAVSETVYKQTTWGPLYMVSQSKLEDGSTIQTILLRRHDGTGQYYTVKAATFLGDDQIPVVTWTDNSKNTSTYRKDGGGGCGSATGLNTVPDLSGWVKSGTGSDGTVIYEPADITNNGIVKKWFALINGDYYDSDGTKHTISYADFTKKHPILAYKDAASQVRILRNTTFGLSAECGKPVVYLYPTAPTKVQVTVGALFHKSIPASTGTWNVTAYPNGNLTTANGQSFPYLYWSGEGKGNYPVITTGTIVPHDQVQTVLRQQLDQLGFTKQEAADFLDFWATRMPTTPYTRLTWLGNKEMDQLAPMTITPRPDVVSRNFLDFEGLQQPVPLAVQTLSAPVRHGFSAMEWGGLLRGN